MTNGGSSLPPVHGTSGHPERDEERPGLLRHAAEVTVLVAAMTAATMWAAVVDSYQAGIRWPYWLHVTTGCVVAAFLSAALWFRRRWRVGALFAFLGLRLPRGTSTSAL